MLLRLRPLSLSMQVESCKVYKAPNRPKSAAAQAIVIMRTIAAAGKCLEGLNNFTLHGRRLQVEKVGDSGLRVCIIIIGNTVPLIVPQFCARCVI